MMVFVLYPFSRTEVPEAETDEVVVVLVVVVVSAVHCVHVVLTDLLSSRCCVVDLGVLLVHHPLHCGCCCCCFRRDERMRMTF